MLHVDVSGCPGSGKSTLCYPLFHDRWATWDGKAPPAHWRPFLDEITSLMMLVKDHPSFSAVIRMNDRSAKKMSTVERMSGDRVFIQTGLVQRILGFGWRLHQMGRDVNLIRRALWLMPVSVGVVFLEADVEVIKERNRKRRDNPATAHEDRSFQIEPMLPAIAVAKEVLRERGVPVLELDVQHQSIDDARAELVAFSNCGPCEPAQMGLGHQEALLRALPPWWRS